MKSKYILVLKILFPSVIILAPLLSACAGQAPTSTPQPTASARAASTPTSAARSSITAFDGYGLYENCSLGANKLDTCLSHLNTMAAAGFKLVLNYEELYGSESAQTAYLQRAQSVGMKVIIPLKDPAFFDGKDLTSEFSTLAQTCNCTDNNGFVRYVVNLVKNNPAVWGYYIGDEVDPDHHDDLKSNLTDLVHQLDPAHPRLFIDSAKHSVAVWRGNSPFFDTTDVIGTDFYPLRGVSSDYPSINEAGAVASGTQAYADTHGKSSAMVLQAFSYSNYGTPDAPYPTVEQMKYVLAQTLANAHPRIILWYSYYDTMSSDNATQNWDNLKSTIAHS
jgi:hypothetical protein